MSDPMFEDERDEALALLWLDDEQDEGHLAVAARVIETWAPPAEQPSPDLLDRVTSLARQRRRPGRAAGPPPPDIDPVETFRRTAHDLASLLSTLDDRDWAATLPGYGTVGATVAHLVGIERISLRWLAGTPTADAADHRRAAQPAVDELAHTPRAEVSAMWHDLATQVADLGATAPTDLAVLAHDIPTDRDGLMLLRAFEVWAHHDDIAVGLGRPRLDLDAGRLLTMSRALAEALPFTFAIGGEPSPDGEVRVVMIGRGGGTYDVAFGTASDPTRRATIVLDTVDACRLAQRRVEPDDVEAVIEGDVDLGRSVLAHVGAFARD